MMLWLDDFRNPANWSTHDGDIIWVKSYTEFVDWVTKHGLPNIVSFDHDLCTEHMEDYLTQTEMGIIDPVMHYDVYEEKTGLDAAKWLVNYCDDRGIKLPDTLVHSANPVGAENIRKYLANARKHLDI